MTVTIPAADNIMLVSNNTDGAVTDASDGTMPPGFPTGFTFTTIHKETALYYSTAYMSPTAATFIMQGKFVGTPTAQPAAGTTTFVFTPLQVGTAQLKNITSVLAPAGSTLTNHGGAGKYFTFYTVDSSNVNHQWYLWFFGSNETDPAPGGTGIKITISVDGSFVGTDTAQIIAQKVQQALNGFQETTIATVAATTPIPAGAYFNIFAFPSLQYVVWYQVNGMGTQPVVVGVTQYIKVILDGTETAAQVATKTQIAMNMKNFAVPDYRGLILRTWDDGAGVDPDAVTRYSLVPGVIGDTIGTNQLSTNLSHLHPYIQPLDIGTAQGGAGAVQFSDTGGDTGYAGGQESRPTNIYVNLAIRY